MRRCRRRPSRSSPPSIGRLCRQLLTELAQITSADEAANWAQRILGAKNSLTAADARQVEDAFRTRMATLESAADIGGVPSSPVIRAPASGAATGRACRNIHCRGHR